MANGGWHWRRRSVQVDVRSPWACSRGCRALASPSNAGACWQCGPHSHRRSPAASDTPPVTVSTALETTSPIESKMPRGWRAWAPSARQTRAQTSRERAMVGCNVSVGSERTRKVEGAHGGLQASCPPTRTLAGRRDWWVDACARQAWGLMQGSCTSWMCELLSQNFSGTTRLCCRRGPASAVPPGPQRYEGWQLF